MQSKNILFLKQDDVALSNKKYFALRYFCDILGQSNASESCYDGYFVSCEIPNGMNSFDLLRFSDEIIINIQLITNFDFLPHQKCECIENEMRKSYFYLQFLNKKIRCYCLCEGDGFYKLDDYTHRAVKVDIKDLLNELLAQKSLLQYEVDVTKLLAHSKFLVSPYKNADAFANGEYSLSCNQQKICDEILCKISEKEIFAYCISASFGSGKTMLAYDLAKRLMAKSQDILIIHGGVLNNGLLRLKLQYGYDICSIKEMAITLHCLPLRARKYSAIIVDDAHRFSQGQINLILNLCYEQDISVIFLYDENQFVSGNTKIYNCLQSEYSNFKIYKAQLREKIRYNREVEYEINKLFKNICINDFCNYSISLSEYIISTAAVKKAVEELENRGYEIINICCNSANTNENRGNKRNNNKNLIDECERRAIVMNVGATNNGFENTNTQIFYGDDFDFLIQLYDAAKSTVSKLKIIAY